MEEDEKWFTGTVTVLDGELVPHALTFVDGLLVLTDGA
jgi:hypothetical protein